MADWESPSCRIVVVSSTAHLARDVAHRIKALSGDGSLQVTSLVPSQDIPWKISNKYYTATVHFRTVQLDYLEHEELDDVSALIYVWNGDESYKEHMKVLSQHLSPSDFEVSLAISTEPSKHEDLEDQFFQEGLEFIDGSLPLTSSNGAAASDGTVAPGLCRALDALSTIMWPSMVRVGHSNHSQSNVQSNAPCLDETDLALQALLADTGAHSDEFATSRASRLQKEMDELERWLEEDVPGDATQGDPWGPEALSAFSSKDHYNSRETSGFDDDFGAFFSGGSSSPRRPDSDFADAHPFAHLDDGGDEADDLPSRNEIKSAASRVFQSGSTHNREQDGDAPAFDLSRILSALQGMKEEVSGIEDIAERRKAAAKVALGIVYGLEGYDEMDNHPST